MKNGVFANEMPLKVSNKQLTWIVFRKIFFSKSFFSNMLEFLGAGVGSFTHVFHGIFGRVPEETRECLADVFGRVPEETCDCLMDVWARS